MANYFVYMVKCRDDSLYTGWTTNVEQRVAQHNLGKGAKYTRARRPVHLIYTKRFSSKAKAMQKEYALKQLSRVQKLTLAKVK